MSDWQPIETAPKDGRPVLLGQFDPSRSHYKRVEVDHWSSPGENRGWIGWGHFNPQFWPATHWMPIPEPPHE
jgi:hypothetical protein